MFLAGLVLILPLTSNADESALLLKSRELAAEYGTLLQAQLQAAMASGGPVEAIAVCKDQAPLIQAELSRRSGADIRRTSSRFRNTANAPDAWETEILAQLESSDAAEYFQTTSNGETRFMKAIPTGPVCLTCHGKELSPAIRAKLDAAYPQDRARGYEINEIRGAFSIRWPADGSD